MLIFKKTKNLQTLFMFLQKFFKDILIESNKLKLIKEYYY